MDDITIDGAAVRFTAALPDRATFDGKFSADAQSISGEASNRMGGVPFQLAKRGEANVKLPPPSSPLSKEFEGTWEGIISAGGNVIRMVLKLWPAPDGTAMGTLTTIDQNQEIPVTTVTIKGKQLQLESRSVSASYFGTLGANGEIAGRWLQLGDGPPLTFKRTSP